MGSDPAPPLSRKAWIALRFVLFGVGGLVLVFFGSGALLIWLTEVHRAAVIKPIVSAPLTVLGILMILYGAGEWKHWRFLWIVPSIPVTFLGILVVVTSLPQRWQEMLDFGPFTILPLLILSAVPALIGRAIIKRRYSRGDSNLQRR